MKWTYDEPYLGCPVRVKLGEIYHYGIYVTDDEILQFGYPPINLNFKAEDVCVLSTDIEVFTAGKFLEVGVLDKKEQKKARKTEQVVAYARQKLGTKGYDILHNNCEHFCYECLFNQKQSSQIDAVKEAFKNRPYVYVYIKKFPFDTDKKIYPKERKKEVLSTSNQKVKEEKFYVWKLLQDLLKTKCDKDIKKVKFYKENAKWMADGFYFSLSHTGDIVAVAVAKNPVGIDVEFTNGDKFLKIKDKMLTPSENDTYLNISNERKTDYLTELWTKKESLFKMQNGDVFHPNNIDTLSKDVISKKFSIDDKTFYLSVACSDAKITIVKTFDDIVKL
jgi:phosphopantetheinyl transferase